MQPDDALQSRIGELEKARAGVFRKIERIYGITRADCTIPPAEQAKLQDYMLTAILSDRWREAVAGDIATSGQPPSLAGSIDRVACRLMEDYVAACYVRHAVNEAYHQDIPSRYQPVFSSCDARQKIVDAYMNHQMNLAEATLEAAGLAPEQAHILNGTIIGFSRSFSMKLLQNEDAARFSPQQGSGRGKTTFEIAARREELKAYPGYVQRCLQERHRHHAARETSSQLRGS